jgi:hypothetical protein
MVALTQVWNPGGLGAGHVVAPEFYHLTYGFLILLPTPALLSV